jgi:hypothetical protein
MFLALREFYVLWPYGGGKSGSACVTYFRVQRN